MIQIIRPRESAYAAYLREGALTPRMREFEAQVGPPKTNTRTGAARARTGGK